MQTAITVIIALTNVITQKLRKEQLVLNKRAHVYCSVFDFLVVVASLVLVFQNIVAGLTINYTEASSMTKLTKKTTVINRGNYGGCQIRNDCGAIVYDRHGDMLWQSSWGNSFQNALLIPYIFEVIFG